MYSLPEPESPDLTSVDREILLDKSRPEGTENPFPSKVLVPTGRYLRPEETTSTRRTLNPEPFSLDVPPVLGLETDLLSLPKCELEREAKEEERGDDRKMVRMEEEKESS